MFTRQDIIQTLRAKEINPGNSGYAAEIRKVILENFDLVEDNLTDESKAKLVSLSKNMAHECKEMWKGAKDFDKMLCISKNKVSFFLQFLARKFKYKSYK